MKKKIFLPLIIFGSTLLIIIALLVTSIIKVNIYNSKTHELSVEGKNLFTDEPEKKGITINAVSRGDDWGKIFDFDETDDIAPEEENFQAYTYDFTITNNTGNTIKKFTFILKFDEQAFLFQGWNGSIEIHQFIDGEEVMATIPDLRSYKKEDYSQLRMFESDGTNYIWMEKDDYIIYHPSHAHNAVEMPIKAHEGTTPGIIMLVEKGKSIENSAILLDYVLNKQISAEPLFWVADIGASIWFIILIGLIIMTLYIRKYNKQHELDNERINESIETFTGFIDAKDPYTHGHSKRVAIYTKLIAEKMGFSGDELDRIYYIALLHDCGKIGVPDNILGKPGKLTNEEFEKIKSHTVQGGDILSSFKSLDHAGEGALFHHERYDGKGYPQGLKGEEIPLIARMICVADSFDAMNSNRVYRDKLKPEYIINELTVNSGTQFDPKIAQVMLDLIKEGKVNIE